MAAESTVRVTVVCTRPGEATLVEVMLGAGATVRDAIAAAGLVPAQDLVRDAPAVGVFGQRRSLDAPVANGDRVEIYRPLTIDPKEARRRRAALRKPRAPA